MSNEQTEKVFLVHQFLRANKSNTGTVFQMAVSNKNGDLVFTIAKQKGYGQDNLPRFDYDNKAVFALSAEEKAKLIQCIQGKEDKVYFPHLNGRSPKKINFENSVYNDKKQLKLSVYVEATKETYGFFFNEVEIMILNKNLQDSISLYNCYNAILATRNV